MLYNNNNNDMVFFVLISENQFLRELKFVLILVWHNGDETQRRSGGDFAGIAQFSVSRDREWLGEYPEEVVLGGGAENYHNIKTKRCFDTGFDITEGRPGFILGVGSFVINYIHQLVYCYYRYYRHYY